MNTTNRNHFRLLRPEDKDLYETLVSEFYASDAVDHPIAPCHIQRTFEELCRSDTYAVCYVLQQDQQPVGYALLAKGFSQEAGGLVIWLDEFYIREQYRGCGMGSAFLSWLARQWQGKASRFRLEVVASHDRIKELYARHGYVPMPYDQMVRETPV